MGQIGRREFAGTLAAGLIGTKLQNAPPQSTTLNAVPPSDDSSITDVPGVRVGHFTFTSRPTGCTAILFDNGAICAIDYDDSGVGSYEGVSFRPMTLAKGLNGMLLTGGGSFGLGAVPGVVKYMEDHGIGLNTSEPGLRLPSVVGGSIFDLQVGDAKIRPGEQSAYKACEAASTRPVEQGNVGAGAGATVGKMLRGYGGMKGGLGSASVRLGDVVIGALAVINGSGDIVDWHTGRMIAGARNPNGKGFANIVETMKRLARTQPRAANWLHDPIYESTNLVVVATNAKFDKPGLVKIATMASTGAARAINPYHTTGDGDSTFAVSTNKLNSGLAISVVGALAADVVGEAVLRAVKMASSIPGWPAYRDYNAS